MRRAFKFRLERLLRVRRIEERAARAALAEAQARLRAAENTRDMHSRSLKEARAVLASSISAGELDPRSTLLSQELLEKQLEQLARAGELALSCETQAAQLRAVFQEREQTRKGLEELEGRARTRHRTALRAAENAELDEVAGMRNARKRLAKGFPGRESEIDSSVSRPAAE